MELPTFSLDQFEGPLDLLIYLIQKEEIDVCKIPLRQVTAQFAAKGLDQIDVKADTLALAASLLLIKSRRLIPNEMSEEEEEEMSARMEMIQQLIEYCRFKEAAKSLGEREASQSIYFPRNAPDVPKELELGLDGVTLEDLTTSLKGVMARYEKNRGKLQDDSWHVDTKILWLRHLIEQREQLSFEALFEEASCQEEVIVTFLALLELMKEGIIRVEKEEGQITIHARN